MGVEATQTHGVHVDAVHHLAAGAAIGFGGVRNRTQAGRLARFGDALRSVESGAGRSVHLGRVVQFDDFRGFEIRRRDLCEMVGEHRGNGEVRRDEHALALTRGRGERGAHLVELLFGPAGGADHHVDALLDEGEHIAQRHARHGEFHHDVGVFGGDCGQVVACVEREREFGVGGGIDGVDHVRTHAAFGTDYGNLDHCSSLMLSRTRMLRMSYVCRAHVFEIACPRP